MKKVILLIIIFIMSGCSNTPNKDIKVTTPEFKVRDFISKTQLSVIASDLELIYPVDMIEVDNYIVVLDAASNPCLKIYSKENGKLINSIINKGRARNEAVGINAGLSCNDSYIGVYDGPGSKMLLLPIKELSNSNLTTLIETKPLPRSLHAQRAYLSNDRVLLRTTSPNRRFVWVNADNTVSEYYYGFPSLVKGDSSVNVNVLSYANNIAISSNGDKIVETAYIGGVMEIIGSNDNGFEQEKLVLYSEPVFDFTDPTESWVTWTEETRQGFSYVQATDDNIVASYLGSQCKDEIDSTYLQVYNWDCIPQKEYVFDFHISLFSVDNKLSYFYTISKDTDGKYQLLKLKL